MPLAAMLLMTAAVSGCGSEVAEQRLASMKPMLARQPAPNCEYRSAGRQPKAADTDPEQQRAKLDYERQCYRHAEMIARSRLRGLQDAVGKSTNTAKAAEVTPPPSSGP